MESSQCILPNIDPFDKSIEQFIHRPDPLSCSENHDVTYLNEFGQVCLNETAVQILRMDLTTIQCVYNIIERYEDDDHILYQPARKVTFPMDIAADFFRVSCSDESGSIYTNLHAHVASKKVSIKSNIRRQTQYNVYIFGIDSVSRLNGIRMLPKTYKYLTDVLGAFDFQGYTKVGDNTFPNMVPLLTGMHPYANPMELPFVDPLYDFYDSYPLIWKRFSQAGYMTMFAEDQPLLGTFNYLSKGFNIQPTDHYMRPFWLSIDDSYPVDKFLSPLLLMLENRKVQLGKSSTLCFGNLPKHVILMKYYEYFIKEYAHLPRFAYSWLTELGHSHLNIIQLADDDFVKFIKGLNAENHFNDSFFIFMSDHGHRFDSIRSTLIGRIEERMPLLLMTIPKNFKNKYVLATKNLQQNTKRLTSPYDMHQTLKDIISFSFMGEDKPNYTNKGISLFKPIPEERTCADAGISENYCTCYKSKSVNITTNIIRRMGMFIVSEINKLLSPKSRCHKLNLNSIKSAHKKIPPTNLIEYSIFFGSKHVTTEIDSGVYTVVIETRPGKGLFEATVDYEKNFALRILGSISRINRYGDQSFCIKDRFLRLYCFCHQ